ncbi:Transcriptional regulator, TetR family [Pseudonocardia sp. Ae168_Ps1]|uniref:TetR/AcrR family transcriptional regulator n=1 Tax=unclassified Pseudonocardia TaxID=2619320 RepID=UPI00094B2EC9|nr:MULTISPECIES: TetR/AcrR family transcriptional regulator [unclassified Pseudonocardia]OLL75264.1 Transcriptional regulator, TetR family [Pseudonocardia sp. Ae150A_Ps1]OLL81258.1 Transcriptional regulator, TetR family [Pseudonocardia sp. Ae168_Ps1]OLL84627.1 Transcriptional regulator, TetR family [Pseudonocardia sp. Ae263_Ps1]OLL95356.1 Transcriptional regulator, TetR family [Pseudonocardia sp. Ae356_Ps1]
MPRPRQFDEVRVLSSVQAAFWDNGYAGTSLDDLLAASGLGKGSLYGAFGDKQSLFLRVLREYDEANDRMLRAWLDQADRALDVIRGFVTGPLRDPGGTEARRGCLLANTAMELSVSTPEVATEARRSYAATTTLLAEAVWRAQCEGDVAARVDPDETAHAVLAGQLGLLVLGRVGQDPAVLSAMAETLLHGLLPTP